MQKGIFPVSALAVALAFGILQTAHAGTALAVSSDGSHPTTSTGHTKSEAIQRALRLCRQRGGVNPRILIATDSLGYGALATATQSSGKGSIIGAKFAAKTKTEAESRAMAECLKRGGVNVHIVQSFRDFGSTGEVFPPNTYSRVSDL